MKRERPETAEYIYFSKYNKSLLKKRAKPVPLRVVELDFNKLGKVDNLM